MSRLLTVLAQTIKPETLDVPKPVLNAEAIQTILQTTFAITGALSLLIITLAGLRFVISRGEPQSVQRARMTVLYALVGLVISLSAFAIVTFVITRL